MKMLPMLAEVGNFFPKVIAQKTPLQTGHPPRRRRQPSRTPYPQTWPHDGGRFITLPCVVTRDPKSGKRNVGMYRMQVYDAKTTGMHWQRQKVAAEHMRDRLRETSPDCAGSVDLMALTAGGTTAASLETLNAATITNPRRPNGGSRSHRHRSRYNFLRHSPRPTRRRRIFDLWLSPPEAPRTRQSRNRRSRSSRQCGIHPRRLRPARELRTEGPFGDHTGFYTMQEDYPVFHVTCITHRKDPIYAATIVGKPPMEDAWMGKAVERIFFPLMQLTLPEIVDVNLPPEGVFHNLMIISIKKSTPVMPARS